MARIQTNHPALPKEQAKHRLTKENKKALPKQIKINSQDAENRTAAAEKIQGNRFQMSSRTIETGVVKYPRITEAVEFAADRKQKKPPSRPEIQKNARRILRYLRT